MIAIALAVLVSTTSDPAPAKALLALAVDSLAAGVLTDASAYAERAVLAARTDAASLQLLTSLCEQLGDPRAGALRGLAGAPRTLPPPAPAPAKAGETLHVVAPLITIRRSASPSAPAAGWLAWGASIVVAGVEGDFARFRQPKLVRGSNVLAAGSVLVDAEPAAVTDPKAWEEVFVHRGFLSPKPRTPEELLGEAEQLLKKGHREDALRWLDAVQGFKPSDELRGRVVRLAVELGYPAMAVRVAKGALRGKAAWGSSGLTGGVTYLLGCRGDRFKAAVVDWESVAAKGRGVREPENGCVSAFTTTPGPPPMIPGACGEYGMSDEEIAADKANPAAKGVRYELEKAAYDKEVARLAARKARVMAAFPDGGWIKVVLRNTTDGYAPPLWRLDLDVPMSGGCDDDRSGEISVARADPLRIPPLPPRSVVELWLGTDKQNAETISLSLSPEREDIFLESASPY